MVGAVWVARAPAVVSPRDGAVVGPWSTPARSRFSRIVPHVVDTFLLASAIGLMVLIGQYPFAQGWLTGKLIGLVLYIVLGTVALKRGRTRVVRGAAFVAAVAVFVWIGMTARMHSLWLIPV